MANEFITGDSKSKVVDLKINGETFVIPVNATVTAQIVSKDKLKVLSSSQAVASNTALGANWTTSKIVIKFAREATSFIKFTASSLEANLEIQISTGTGVDIEDTTFYIPIVLVKGNL